MSINGIHSQHKTACEILAMMGGDRFVKSLGIKNFVPGTYDLTFSIPVRNKGRYKKVTITKVSQYSYRIEFKCQRDFRIYTEKKIDGVCWDKVPKLFSEYTGLTIH